MKQTYKELKRADKEVGLTLDVNKMKIMAPSWCDTHTGKEMKIGGDTIEVSHEFVYLGACIIKHTCELTQTQNYSNGQQCTAVPTPNRYTANQDKAI